MKKKVAELTHRDIVIYLNFVHLIPYWSYQIFHYSVAVLMRFEKEKECWKEEEVIVEMRERPL